MGAVYHAEPDVCENLPGESLLHQTELTVDTPIADSTQNNVTSEPKKNTEPVVSHSLIIELLFYYLFIGLEEEHCYKYVNCMLRTFKVNFLVLMPFALKSKKAGSISVNKITF